MRRLLAEQAVPGQPSMVMTLRLTTSNVFAIRGRHTILVDTGDPGNGRRILAHLAQHGVASGDIALILLTHGHVDHIGSAAELQRITGAPVAIHRHDVEAARRGQNPALPATRRRASLLKPFLKHRSPPIIPDIVFDGDLDLEAFGVDGCVIPTPGHTAGSVSVVLPTREIIVGDMLMGGHVGGQWQPHVPRMHYFAENLPHVWSSLRTILRLEPRTLYVGHGGPLDPRAVTHRFGATSGL